MTADSLRALSTADGGPDPEASAICTGCHAVGALDLEIEARVTARLERDAWMWRFRLVAIETLMLAALVAAAGLTLGQPVMVVLRAALIVGATCFASGLLLLSLSAGTARLLTRVRRWRHR
ncbi:hypothetical protein [Sphingomonas immobilis]|uniref:Uncharacterized protein n=1 Tax=Sphingomonas immobilis TaxID=3063997 RepID=A0ABT8ZVY5_9SPHN|nr:hypothetical protein [Sphingomonas sp. CA1-15]MDO7841733.1 hypothetical protein [Sphingomonas sp. CA1-15]